MASWSAEVPLTEVLADEARGRPVDTWRVGSQVTLYEGDRIYFTEDELLVWHFWDDDEPHASPCTENEDRG